MVADRSQYPFKKKQPSMFSACCHCELDYVWVRRSAFHRAFTNPLKSLPALRPHSLSSYQKKAAYFLNDTFSFEHVIVHRCVVFYFSTTHSLLYIL